MQTRKCQKLIKYWLQSLYTENTRKRKNDLIFIKKTILLIKKTLKSAQNFINFKYILIFAQKF